MLSYVSLTMFFNDTAQMSYFILLTFQHPALLYFLKLIRKSIGRHCICHLRYMSEKMNRCIVTAKTSNEQYVETTMVQISLYIYTVLKE